MSEPETESRLLRLEKAAERMDVTARWLRAHRKDLPFIVELGPRVYRVDVDRMERWLERRKA